MRNAKDVATAWRCFFHFPALDREHNLHEHQQSALSVVIDLAPDITVGAGGRVLVIEHCMHMIWTKGIMCLLPDSKWMPSQERGSALNKIR